MRRAGHVRQERNGGRPIAVALLLALAVATTGHGQPPPDRAGAAMPDPPGFISFCLRFPGQCETRPEEPSKVVLNDQTRRSLQDINSRVNDAIWPESDDRHYGRPEYWTIPTDGYGDCEDYALTKRKALIDRRFPQRALRMAVANTPGGERHAVLIVATDRGDFVLDNLTNAVVERHQTPYIWIEEQDASNPRAWVSMQTDPSTDGQAAVGSVK
jgi:predicted transglutaminase-like cysteine proteinase